jgi:hypothetical protein
MEALGVNQSLVVEIVADKHWNHTKIILQKDATYEFNVPDAQDWKDWFISTDANGFSKWYLEVFEKKRRYPTANWFALIGTIDKEVPFIIGKTLTSFRPKQSGELICYANDLPTMYHNNKGKLDLTVSRLS